MAQEELMTISARVKPSQLKEVERLANERGSDRSAAVRELLAIGIRQHRMEQALDWVRRGRATVWKAARHAQLTYREMLELLRTHNVPFPLSGKEMEREIEAALGRQ